MNQLLFSYGTLRQPEVQRATFGRELAGSDDAIAGHLLGEVRIDDPHVVKVSGSAVHPVLVPSSHPDATVPGTVFEVDADELTAADAYEVGAYVRRSFSLTSGRTAWVYVLAGTPDEGAEEARATELRAAEGKAAALFDEVVARGMVAPGRGERELSDAIRDLAFEMFGIERFWHKRIVRAGPNTVHPYRANPPDRVLDEDDIVFFDFGPILQRWEADFGRTYVLGDNPGKHRLAADLPVIWQQGKAYFDAHPEVTGAELFDHVLGRIAERGWGHGASHAGHLVGEFPHERINGDEITCYITRGSTEPMRRPDATGQRCHWILEVHLVSPDATYGGFYEQLLDI